MKLDLNGVLKFPFADKRWPAKVVIGSLLAVIPIVNFLVMGYLFRIYQLGIRKEARQLPEWSSDQLMSYFILGVAGTLAGIIYAIPLFGLVFLSLAISAVNELFNTVGSVMVILVYLLSIAVSVCIPFVIGAYLENEQFKDVLDARRIWGYFRSCFWDAIRLYAFLFVVTALSSLINNTIPLIGLVVTTPLVIYVGMVVFRGFGEIYPVAGDVQASSDVACSVNAMVEEAPETIVAEEPAGEDADSDEDNKDI